MVMRLTSRKVLTVRGICYSRSSIEPPCLFGLKKLLEQLQTGPRMFGLRLKPISTKVLRLTAIMATRMSLLSQTRFTPLLMS